MKLAIKNLSKILGGNMSLGEKSPEVKNTTDYATEFLIREKIRKNPEKYLKFYEMLVEKISQKVERLLKAKDSPENSEKPTHLNKYEQLIQKQIEPSEAIFKENQEKMIAYLAKFFGQNKFEEKSIEINSQNTQYEIPTTEINDSTKSRTELINQILKNLTKPNGKEIKGKADFTIVPGGLAVFLESEDLINILGLAIENRNGKVIKDRNQIQEMLGKQHGGFGFTLNNSELKPEFTKEFGGKIIFISRENKTSDVVLHEIKEILADYFIEQSQGFEEEKKKTVEEKSQENLQPEINKILRQKLADLAARIEDGDDLAKAKIGEIGFRLSKYNGANIEGKQNYLKAVLLSKIIIKASQRYLGNEESNLDLQKRNKLANLLRSQSINPADFLALTSKIGNIDLEEEKLQKLYEQLSKIQKPNEDSFEKIILEIFKRDDFSKDNEDYLFLPELQGRMIHHKPTRKSGDKLTFEGYSLTIDKILDAGGFGAVYTTNEKIEIDGKKMEVVVKELINHIPEWLFEKIRKIDPETLNSQKNIEDAFVCEQYHQDLKAQLNIIRSESISDAEKIGKMKAFAKKYKQEIIDRRGVISTQFNNEFALLERLANCGVDLPKPIGLVTKWERMFGIDQDFHFIIMEKAEGEKLEKELPTLSEENLIILANLILKNLVILHQNKVIHKDLNPRNIYIKKDSSGKIEILKIIDLGISKGVILTGEIAKTRSGTSMVGTVGYAPPEQVQGTTDARTDLYALGKILYKFASGNDPEIEKPYENPEVLISKIKQNNPNFNPKLLEFIEKLIQLKPDDRFQSAEEAKKELEKISKSKQTHGAAPIPRNPAGNKIILSADSFKPTAEQIEIQKEIKYLRFLREEILNLTSALSNEQQGFPLTIDNNSKTLKLKYVLPAWRKIIEETLDEIATTTLIPQKEYLEDKEKWRRWLDQDALSDWIQGKYYIKYTRILTEKIVLYESLIETEKEKGWFKNNEKIRLDTENLEHYRELKQRLRGSIKDFEEETKRLEEEINIDAFKKFLLHDSNFRKFLSLRNTSRKLTMNILTNISFLYIERLIKDKETKIATTK